MNTIEIDLATDSLGDYAESVGDQALVVMRGGQAVAVLFPIDSADDLESIALFTNPRFMAMIEQSRKSAREQGTISADEMRRRVQQWEVDEPVFTPAPLVTDDLRDRSAHAHFRDPAQEQSYSGLGGSVPSQDSPEGAGDARSAVVDVGSD